MQAAHDDEGARDRAVDRLVCSARGCRTAARWALHWNNPRLHTPDRRKTWLACDGHRGDLERFLDLRGFLREVRASADLTAPPR